MALLPTLRAQVDEHSVACGEPRTDRAEVVLLVPPTGSLERGLARALTLVADGARVRLIGDGVTLATSWPDGLPRADGVRLTEYGAYRVGDAMSRSADVRERIDAWTRRVFGDAVNVPARAGIHPFYVATCARIAQRYLDAYVFVAGIAALHDDTSIEVVDGERWWYTSALEARTTRPRLPPIAFGVAVRTLAIAGSALALGHAVRSFLRSAASRAELAKYRASTLAPRVWIGAVPDQVRSNARVIESVAEPVLARGEPLGVVLLQSLGTGVRTESNLRRASGSELWPGIQSIRDGATAWIVDQAVGPETASQLANDLARSVVAIARVTAGVVREGPTIDLGAVRIDLGLHLRELVPLVTLDVSRAVAASSATQRFCARHAISGSLVALCGSGFPQTAVPDRVLSGAGATTMEVYHGTGGDVWYGASETAAAIRSVFSELDAKLQRTSKSRIVVGGTPQRVPRRTGARPRVIHVLIMSNFVHRDSRSSDGRFPGEPFQRAILAVVGELRAHVRDELVFRWRPHPADDPATVDAQLARAVRIELSRGRSLDEDASWADAVVSSQSSALVELLFAGVPVFGFRPPAEAVAMEYLAPERTFFHPGAIVEPFRRAIAAVEANSPDALSPERRAREALFGPSLEPHPIALEAFIAAR